MVDALIDGGYEYVDGELQWEIVLSKRVDGFDYTFLLSKCDSGVERNA